MARKKVEIFWVVVPMFRMYLPPPIFRVEVKYRKRDWEVLETAPDLGTRSTD